MAVIADSEDKVLGLGALALSFCLCGEQRPAGRLTPTLVGGRGLQPPHCLTTEVTFTLLAN